MNPSNQGYNTPPEFGVPEIIPVTTPGAGVGWSQTVPVNTIWLLLAINFRLVTAVAAATRTVLIQINDGSNASTIGLAGQSQLAALTRDYLFTLAQHGNLVDTIISGNINERLYLRPGWILASSIANIQAADQVSIITLYVHRWLTQ